MDLVCHNVRLCACPSVRDHLSASHISYIFVKFRTEGPFKTCPSEMIFIKLGSMAVTLY